jgi:hypothetical protein
MRVQSSIQGACVLRPVLHPVSMLGCFELHRFQGQDTGTRRYSRSVSKFRDKIGLIEHRLFQKWHDRNQDPNVAHQDRHPGDRNQDPNVAHQDRHPEDRNQDPKIAQDRDPGQRIGMPT